MQRATPVQMRKSLEVVEAFKKAGLWFVPMPVFDENDFNNRVAEMAAKLEEAECRANLAEAKKPIAPPNAQVHGRPAVPWNETVRPKKEKIMNIVLWIFAGLFLWFLIGCVALSALDDKEQRLFKWAASAPIPLLYELAVMAWPVVLWFWWNDKTPNAD